MNVLCTFNLCCVSTERILLLILWINLQGKPFCALLMLMSENIERGSYFLEFITLHIVIKGLFKDDEIQKRFVLK